MSIKNSYTKIAALCAIVAFTACKEEIETYSGDSGIFFAMLQSGSDESNPRYTESSLLPFALTNGLDSTFILRAKIIGEVKDYDRQVAVDIIEDKSTAVASHDYDPLPLNIIVRAGAIYADIPIHFMRKPSLNGQEVTLTLRLCENGEFKLLMPRWLPISGTDKIGVDVIEHKLTVSDKYEKLEGWSDMFYGPYSDKKIKLMCREFNLTLNSFVKDALGYVESKVLGQKLDKYLKDMEAKGETVYEDYVDGEGNPVKMVSGTDIK